MNEHDDTGPITFLLEGLAPGAPPADLMRRLLSARPTFAPPPKSKFIAFLPVFARAAAVAVLAGTATWFVIPGAPDPTIVTVPPVATPAVAAGAPQESLQRLVGMRDLGFARDAQHRPVRLMHATWLDDHTYVPSNGSPPVRESRVRDEIVPVVLNTY